MTLRRALWILLPGVAVVAACTTADPGSAGNTELNVIVPNGAPSLGGGSSAPALIDITTVEYTITCAGNNDTFLDNNASFPDEVRIDGNLEVVDDRTDTQGPIPPEFGTPRPGDGAEIWQGFMDLPPGPCSIELRARDNDGEVICTAIEPFVITADTTTKVNLVLICDISFQAPVGMLDVDGTFSFNVGNFCPDLFILNCLDTNPVEQLILPPPNPPLAVTTCEVRFRDGDSTCGQSCDPQSCTPTATGLSCVPGPDPGVSTTITCNAAALLDCEGDGIPDASCTLNGDTLGVLPESLDGTVPCSTDVDCGVPGAICVGAFCDFSAASPPLNASFIVACLPPALGGFGGATVTCTAVTTDGDLDCNKTKVVNVNCPSIEPCEQYAADGFVCDDGNPCTANTCNDVLAVGGGCGFVDNGPCCESTNVPDGTDCSAEQPPLAQCEGGVCVGGDCTQDSDCNDGNECTFDTCNLGTGICSNVPNTGVLCDQGGVCPPGDGTCDAGGVCQPNNSCITDAACPNTPAPPADPQCTAPVCVNPPTGCATFCDIDLNANAGGTCDFSGPGAADGTCLSDGTCFASGNPCTAQSATVFVGCTNSVTAAQSPFPFTLDVTNVNGGFGVVGGSAFTADFGGVGVFPEFFLDAAQGVVPGGVQTAELVDIVATVQVRSGATGPDVPLVADTSSLVPGAVLTCTVPAGTVCTIPGPASPDCAGGFGDCTIPAVLAGFPTSSDCSVGGVCDLLGKGDNAPGCTLGTQCCNNGFCVTGDLLISFLISTGNFTADASGSVLFGWADGVGAGTTPVPDLVLCPAAAPNCTDPFMPDGCYDLPAAVFANPTPPIGIRVNASGLFVPIQCAGGTPGGICASGEGCIVDADCATAPCTLTTDVICPTPDADLIACPIN